MARPSLEFTFILGTFYKYVLPKINKETTHIYLTVSLQKYSRVFKQIDNSLNLCAMFNLHSIYYPQADNSLWDYLSKNNVVQLLLLQNLLTSSLDPA